MEYFLLAINRSFNTFDVFSRIISNGILNLFLLLSLYIQNSDDFVYVYVNDFIREQCQSSPLHTASSLAPTKSLQVIGYMHLHLFLAFFSFRAYHPHLAFFYCSLFDMSSTFHDFSSPPTSSLISSTHRSCISRLTYLLVSDHLLRPFRQPVPL